MNPIDSLFQRQRISGRKAFIPFLTAGDPDIRFAESVLPRLAGAGADLIEVGFPFSDPIADGPVIQASYTRALEKGLKLEDVFQALGRVTASTDWKTPIVGMVSYSLVYRYGPAKFIDRAKRAGLDGAIVPDLTAEEASEFSRLARDNDFALILLVTPTTTPQRAAQIVKLSTGFLYCVSVVGITGEREGLPQALRGQLQQLRGMTDLPLCVGFGVSKPAQVKELREIADGVIVGSALVKKLEKARDAGGADVADEIVQSVGELAAALHE